jgi:cell shape-determining protein MreD
MSITAFIILAWLFIGLELGLKDALALGQGNIAPSFVYCLLTFVAMFSQAPRPTWVAMALGLLMDLTARVPLRDGAGTATIIGPHVLAFVLSVQLVTSLRGVVIKRNPLTVGFLAMLGSLVAQVALVAIYSIRLWWNDPIFPATASPSGELFARLASAPYTGALGVLVAALLFPMSGWLGLSHQTRKR